MRKILFKMMACMALGLLTSCLDLDRYTDDSHSVPKAVYIQDAEDVTSTSAYLRGDLQTVTHHGTFTFWISETENFTETLECEAQTDLSYKKSFSCAVHNLKPSTTYYYKLVGTDGYASVSSEVKSFTTLKGFELGKITYTDWDGTIKEVADSMMPLGISLFTNGGEEQYWNMSVSKKDGKWQLPYDFSNTKEYGTPYYCTVYTPKYNDFLHEKYGIIAAGYTDYLTGSAEISENSNAIDINLTHSLARVRFHFTIANGSSCDYVYATKLLIEQDESQKIIPTLFWYNLSGTGSVYKVVDFGSIDYINQFYIWKGKTSDVTILTGPTRSSGTVTLKVTCNDEFVLSLPIELKADSWKSGGTYDYNITYDMNELYITDVKVTEWNNNQGGNINIYD